MSETPDARRRIENAIRAALDERVEQLRGNLEARWTEIVGEAVEGLAAPVELDESLFAPGAASEEHDDLLSRVHDSVRSLSGASDQVSLLNRLVEASSGFAGRTALFVVRRERAVGWMAVGFREGAGAEDIRQVALPLDGDSPLARAVASQEAVVEEGSGDARLVWEALQAGGSERFAALPVSVRGRVAAVLFCDAGDSPDSPALRSDALRILVRFAETHLGGLSQRGRHGRSDSSAVERRPSQAWEHAQAGAAAAHAEMAAAPPPVHEEAPELVTAPPEPVADGGDAHEEARRFARLLVSEILLYNESKVEEGRQHGDLYERLREDLERSEQMYRQRAAAEVVESTDYFHEEVVRTLAQGDAGLLGSR